MKGNVKRHLIKTVSWRFFATIDTLLIIWFITGNMSYTFKVGFFEILTKSTLYYFHEYFWFKTRIRNSSRRHIFKTFSWRIIGTFDTIILSWLVTGNPLSSMRIGLTEVVSKMILYFVHEKLWYKNRYGLGNKSLTSKESH